MARKTAARSSPGKGGVKHDIKKPIVKKKVEKQKLNIIERMVRSSPRTSARKALSEISNEISTPVKKETVKKEPKVESPDEENKLNVKQDPMFDGLCEYEVIRMRNIMERQAMFQSLDMEDAKLELTPSRPKHVPSSRGDCPGVDNTGDDHLGDNSDDYSDLRQITTPTIPSYQGTPCIQFLRQGQKRRVDKEDSDVETTTDEETEVELEKNFKIDTEDEFDLADFSDEEDKTLQASARLLSAGEKARDQIMGWTDSMDDSE